MGEFSAKLESDLNEYGSRNRKGQFKQRYVSFGDGSWAIPLVRADGTWLCSIAAFDQGVIVREMSECHPEFTESIEGLISERERELIRLAILKYGVNYPPLTPDHKKVKLT